jgi:hypothetical protein
MVEGLHDVHLTKEGPLVSDGDIFPINNFDSDTLFCSFICCSIDGGICATSKLKMRDEGEGEGAQRDRERREKDRERQRERKRDRDIRAE